MCPGAGRLSQLGQEGPWTLGHPPAETFVLGYVRSIVQPRHVNVSIKDTIDSYGQYTPRILGIWVDWFFFLKVLSLSPYNGDCATWLIMCFQNYKFSDDRRGPRWSHGGWQNRLIARKHQQVKNLTGWPWQLGLQVLQHATCAIWGPRLKLARSRGVLEGDVYCSNAMHFTACHWTCIWMT